MKVRNSSVLLLLPILFLFGYFLIFGLVGVIDQVEGLISSITTKTLEENNSKAMEVYVAERKKWFKEMGEALENSYGPTISEITSIKNSIESGSVSTEEFKTFSAMFHVNPELRDQIIWSTGKQ